MPIHFPSRLRLGCLPGLVTVEEDRQVSCTRGDVADAIPPQHQVGNPLMDISNGYHDSIYTTAGYSDMPHNLLVWDPGFELCEYTSAVRPHLCGGALKKPKSAWDGPREPWGERTIKPHIWWLAGGRGPPPTRDTFEQRRQRAADQNVTHHYWTSEGDIRGHKGSILGFWKTKAQKERKKQREAAAEQRTESQMNMEPTDTAAHFQDTDGFDDGGSGGHPRAAHFGAAVASNGRDALPSRPPPPARLERTLGNPSAGGAPATRQPPIRHAPVPPAAAVVAALTRTQTQALPHRPRAPAPLRPTQSRTQPKASRATGSRNTITGGSTAQDMGGLGPNGGEPLDVVSTFDQRHPPPATAESVADSAFVGQGVRLSGSTSTRGRGSASRGTPASGRRPAPAVTFAPTASTASGRTLPTRVADGPGRTPASRPTTASGRTPASRGAPASRGMASSGRTVTTGSRGTSRSRETAGSSRTLTSVRTSEADRYAAETAAGAVHGVAGQSVYGPR